MEQMWDFFRSVSVHFGSVKHSFDLLLSGAIHVVSTVVSSENLDQFRVGPQWKLLSRQVDEVLPLLVSPQGFHADQLSFHN